MGPRGVLKGHDREVRSPSPPLCPTLSDDEDSSGGDRVGPYRLVRLVGKNSCDFSYLAEPTNRLDRKHRHPVVIKLLRGPRAQDPVLYEAIKRRLSSARKAPSGARVVRLVGAWKEEAEGRLRGCYCLATAPYCSGGLMEDLIRKRPRSYNLATALRWAKEVAETLHLLHAVGVYHLALSTADVLLKARGEDAEGWETVVRGLDDRVYCEEEGRRPRPSMAPEWGNGGGGFRGRDEAKEKADVWSWGMLLWSLLARQVPEDRWAEAKQAWEYMRSLSSSPSAASEMEVELRAQWAGEEGGLPLGVLQLLRLCLSDRKSRPSMVQVLGRLGLLLSSVESRSPYSSSPFSSPLAGEGDEREAMERLLYSRRERKKEATAMVMPPPPPSPPPVDEPKEEVSCAAVTINNEWWEEEKDRTPKPLPTSPSRMASTLSNLASASKARGEYVQALSLFEEVLELRRSVLPSNHPDLTVTLVNLGSLYRLTGDYTSALPLYQEALELRRKVLPAGHHDVAALTSALAEISSKLPAVPVTSTA